MILIIYLSDYIRKGSNHWIKKDNYFYQSLFLYFLLLTVLEK